MAITKPARTMRQAFRDVSLTLGEQDDNLVLVFGDVSVYLFREFYERYPNRFYNAGICENTLISLSAGLSAQGFFPVTHTINPFLTERSIEQIKLDMAYNQFGGNIVTCGASFDYAWDGATHHCYAELSMLRYIPGTEIMQPGTAEEFVTLLESQYRNGKTSYFRTSEQRHSQDFPVEFGKGVVIRDSNAPVTVVTAGPLLDDVLAACVDLNVNILYFHTLKPIDHELLNVYRHTHLLIVHDAHGLYEAVCELGDINASRHGLPDEFLGHYGTADKIREAIGLDPSGIRQVVSKRLNKI